jgi:hypothetical protein
VNLNTSAYAVGVCALAEEGQAMFAACEIYWQRKAHIDEKLAAGATPGFNGLNKAADKRPYPYVLLADEPLFTVPLKEMGVEVRMPRGFTSDGNSCWADYAPLAFMVHDFLSKCPVFWRDGQPEVIDSAEPVDKAFHYVLKDYYKDHFSSWLLPSVTHIASLFKLSGFDYHRRIEKERGLKPGALIQDRVIPYYSCWDFTRINKKGWECCGRTYRKFFWRITPRMEWQGGTPVEELYPFDPQSA